MTLNDRTDLTVTDVSGGCSCCATGAAIETAAPGSATTTEVMVAGMTCSHCVTSVTEELTAIDRVDAVTVNLNAGGASTVTISSDGPIDAAAVRAAVEEAGYSLAAERA